MDHLDGLTDIYFERTTDGRVIFYPWGVLAPGYAVPTDEKYRALHRFVTRYVMVSLGGVAAAGVFLGWHGLLGALPVSFLAYVFGIRKWTEGLARTGHRLDYSATYRSLALSYGIVRLWLSEVLSLVLVAAGVAMLVLGRDRPLLWIATILLFGAGAIALGFMIREHYRS